MRPLKHCQAGLSYSRKCCEPCLTAKNSTWQIPTDTSLPLWNRETLRALAAGRRLLLDQAEINRIGKPRMFFVRVVRHMTIVGETMHPA